MAFHFTSGDEAELPVNHDINVTPFIDVMLVLLIIFMVAAPLATVDTKVDLPVSNAAPATKPEKPVFLTVKADGGLLVIRRTADHTGQAVATAGKLVAEKAAEKAKGGAPGSGAR